MLDRKKHVLKNLKDGLVIPAIPLALHKDLSFDERRQRALIRYYLNAGAGGIAVAVHTTQFEIRDHAETHERLMQLTMEEITSFEKAHDRTIVKISGVSGTTSDAVAEANKAKDKGYDLILASPGAFSQDKDTTALVAYYERLSEVMPVFGFYLQEAVGGRFLPYTFWQTIFTIENVIGVKIASFNRYRTMDVIRAIQDSGRSQEIAVYTGNDDHIVFDLLSKFTSPQGDEKFTFDGGLLGQWSVWTKKAVEMLQAVKVARQTGHIPESLIVEANELTDANGAIFDVLNNFKGSIAGIHEVLRRQGFFDDITCYEQNGLLSPGQEKEITRVIERYPHLTDDRFVESNLARWLGA